MSPTVDTIVAQYEQALLANDYATLSGITHALLKMMLFGDKDIAKNGRKTAQAILVLREAHHTLDPPV